MVFRNRWPAPGCDSREEAPLSEFNPESLDQLVLRRQVNNSRFPSLLPTTWVIAMSMHPYDTVIQHLEQATHTWCQVNTWYRVASEYYISICAPLCPQATLNHRHMHTFTTLHNLSDLSTNRDTPAHSGMFTH